MYAKSTRPSAKREVQKERSAKRDDRIARPRRAQNCERSELRAMRMCPRSGQIFSIYFSQCGKNILPLVAQYTFRCYSSKPPRDFKNCFDQIFQEK